MSSPVAIVFGAGPNVGASVAKRFHTAGYKVAVISRTGSSDADQDLSISADLSDPAKVESIFAEVSEKLGHPEVVIYNAYGLTMANPQDPLSLDPTTFAKDLTVNTSSAYAAAHEALKSFRALGADGKKGTFIFTGNILNTGVVVAPFFGLGVGKSATAYFIQAAAQAYGSQGFRFYYADQRKETGAPVGTELNGEAHADLYLELAQSAEQGPWQATFVKGKGYTKF